MFINKKNIITVQQFYIHFIRTASARSTTLIQKGARPLFMEARPFSEFYSPFFIAYTLRFNPHGDYNRLPRSIP